MKRIVVAMRTRSEGDWYSTRHHMRLEKGGEIANSITSVQMDCMILEYEDNDSESGRQGQSKHKPE